MDINFDLGIYNGVFAVPNIIVDGYIKLATGDNLKVLLYCMRHGGEKLSAGEISRVTGVAPDNVVTSLEFWQQRFNTAVASAEQSVLSSPPEVSKSDMTPLLERDYDFSPKEIADTIKSKKDVQYLFSRCEELYGRPLKPNEMKALAVITEEVGMKTEVVLMMLEYCFSVEKTTTRYIKTLAKSWIEQGIETVKEAETEIQRAKEYHTAENELKQLMKVRDFSDKAKPLVKKWLFELHKSVDEIYQAYQITLDKTGKLEYKYMDTILSNPNKKETNPISQKQPQTSFDLNDLDKQIMQEYSK